MMIDNSHSSDTSPLGAGLFILVKFPVRNPSLEQSFFKNKKWQPGNTVKLYEKSKDIDGLLSPLALKNFNPFNYMRNSSSP